MGALDGVVHAIGFAPESCLGKGVLLADWPDVSTAFEVSAYSLKVLADGVRSLLSRAAGGGSIVGFDFDATVAWPGYDWMGVAKAALESLARYLARDLGPVASASTSSLPARSGRWLRSRSPVSRRSRTYGTGGPRSGGTCATPRRSPGPAWRCSWTCSRARTARSCTSTAAFTPRRLTFVADIRFSSRPFGSDRLVTPADRQDRRRTRRGGRRTRQYQ